MVLAFASHSYRYVVDAVMMKHGVCGLSARQTVRDGHARVFFQLVVDVPRNSTANQQSNNDKKGIAHFFFLSISYVSVDYGIVLPGQKT